MHYMIWKRVILYFYPVDHVILSKNLVLKIFPMLWQKVEIRRLGY